MPRMEIQKTMLARKRNSHKTKGKTAKEFSCQKCGKDMKFYQQFEKIANGLGLTNEQRIEHLEHQVTVCEHCWQAYGYLKRGKGLKLMMLKDEWIQKQSKETRESISTAIQDLRQSLATVKLVKAWKKVIQQ